jgi:hypothetical protein
VQSGLGYSVDASFVDALEKAPPSDIHTYLNDQPHGANYRDVTLTTHTTHTLITIEVCRPLKPPTTRFTFSKGE